MHREASDPTGLSSSASGGKASPAQLLSNTDDRRLTLSCDGLNLKGSLEWRTVEADNSQQGAFRLNSPLSNVRATSSTPEERLPKASRLRGEGVAVDTSSSPLLTAVWEGNCEALPELLKSGDANARDGNIDRPALSLAAQWEGIGVEMMKLLHERGADVTAVDARHCTALNIAAEAGILDNVEWLVKNGANVNWRNAKKQTPLYAAASKNRLAVVRFLLENFAYPDIETLEGATPLFIAAQNGFVDVVKILYEFKADIHKAKEGGATPLFIACQLGHYKVARFLGKKIESTCVDTPTDKGLTPLMVAAQLGHVDIVKLLLELGADHELCWRGKNVLGLAKEREQKEVVKILTMEPKDGWDPDEAAESCTGCSAPFTMTRRRHHCRACKHIYCSSCSQKRMIIPCLRWLGPLRVCDNCSLSLPQLQSSGERKICTVTNTPL